ncbi:PREDICTED: facilitated trehalose transporter Tret1-like [Papilio xuthus]|uniref:Facilitated trehalose transporter Tret1-like n=1 Tax=Papilio xuthus TaxID=66420 RepID=A0AAJ6ZAX8_PAPXU|nr:PREDICTED: facilitated trehalose transporter Tret1-like [Papilio xuthus]
MLVLTSGSCYSLGIGISLAHPSALNAAILSPNATDIKATIDQASWIASIQGFSGLIGFFVFAPLIQILGRKPVNILFQICLIIGWILLFISKSVTMLLIAKFMQGLSIGGLIVIGLTISEFTHRNKRGVFLTIKKTVLSFGSLLCHCLALYYDWRRIAEVAIIPHVLAIIIITFCPESPSFYAVKGKYSDCMKSFVWYHGDSYESKREMNSLIAAQMERRCNKQKRKDKKFRWFKKLLRRDFLIPFLIATLATIAVDFSALCISTLVIKSFKRRTILFKFGTLSIALMYSVTLSEVCFTISMEIFPLEHRAIGSLTTGIAFTLFYAITMKIVPLMIIRMGVGGTYFVFSLCVTICLAILYYILPETKDKSLQEIEDEIKGIKRTDAEIELIISNGARNF